MKKLWPIIILLLLLCVVLLCSWALDKEQSHIEQFLKRTGVLIEKTFVDIGTMKMTDAILTVQVVTFEHKYYKIQGVKLTKNKCVADEYFAFLDTDEVYGLIETIKFLQNKTLLSTPRCCAESIFTSRGGFQVGCDWNCNRWQIFFRMTPFNSRSTESENSLSKLLALLSKAQVLLQ